jgi:hypothetical protein
VKREHGGELAVVAAMVTGTPAKTRTVNSPSPWLS